MLKKIFLFVAGLLIYSVTFSQIDLGAKHNQMVEYLDNYDFTGKTSDDFMDDLIYTTGKLFDENAFPEGKFGLWGFIQFCGKADPGGLERVQTYESVVSMLEQTGKISPSTNSFLINIATQTENSSDYNSFSAKITELENGYNIASLPDGEKNIVLGLLSVFKSSASYWNNYFSADEETPDPSGRFSLRCFWCVAKKDLMGAALGFLIGNCLCKKFGVVNPVICGSVGAVAFGALYSWAAKVCPNVCNRCKKPRPGSYPDWICRLPFLYL